MSKLYTLVADATDGYYGNPLVNNILFTEEQKNSIDKNYLKWIKDLYAVKINGEITDFYRGESFMQYLKEVEGMYINFRAWEGVYWKEMRVPSEEEW